MSLLSVVFEKSAIEIGELFKCECVGDPLKEDKGRSQIYFLAKRNSQYTKTQCPMNLKIRA